MWDFLTSAQPGLTRLYTMSSFLPSSVNCSVLLVMSSRASRYSIKPYKILFCMLKWIFPCVFCTSLLTLYKLSYSKFKPDGTRGHVSTFTSLHLSTLMHVALYKRTRKSEQPRLHSAARCAGIMGVYFDRSVHRLPHTWQSKVHIKGRVFILIVCK